MKRAVHGKRPLIKDGKKVGDIAGEPWCGAKSSRTDSWDRVTCERCHRLAAKRTWIPN